MLRTYFELIKPGIVHGNAMVAVGGFLFASDGQIDLRLFVLMIVGLSLVMGSACVVNNCIDRDIDAVMKRTKKRATVTGEISIRHALMYAAVLGALGVACLFFTNALALDLAIAGFFLYVVAYGIWKRRSPIGAVVGSLSGAIPPVVGYCAVTGRIDVAAVLLFIVLVSWQMPHFYSIAIYRAKDYKAARIPTLTLVKGVHNTKIHIVSYVAAFVLATSLLTIFHYAGITYVGIMIALGGLWLVRGVQGFWAKDNDAWARKMFGVSLLTIMGFSVAISANAWLP
jgi:protoheme IX farnesyltransferase